jgi:hypothetical protein
VRSSIWGLVAGLTRPNGFLLSVMLLTAVGVGVHRGWREWRRASAGSSTLPVGSNRPDEWMPRGSALLAALMPVAGTAAYSLFAYGVAGDPFVWLRLHEMWGRGKTGVWDLLATHYEWISVLGLKGYVTAMPIDFINTLAALIALAAVWPVTRRLGVVYGVFILVNVAAPLSSGTTLSLARMTSTLFPLFLWLAVVIPAKRRSSWIAVFAVLQGLSAVLFYTWHRLY